MKKNITFLKKRFNISYLLLFFIILIISMLLFRKITIYLLFLLVTATFTYLNYYIRLPFDLSPVLFLSLIISREYSFLFSVIFILLSGILPMILAGGSFDHTTIFYLSLIIIINLVNSILVFLPYYILIVSLIIAHHIIAFFGSISFGNNPHKELFNLIMKITIDMIYIFSFYNLLISIIK